MSKNSIIFSVLVLLLIVTTIDTNAQRRKVLNLPSYDEDPKHFGFIIGMNHLLFTIKPVDNMSDLKWDSDQSPDVYGDSMYVYSITSMPTPGFSVGILANLRLGKYTDLRFIPSLLFGERSINYNILRYNSKDDDHPILFVEVQKNITSTIIELPLEFRYKSKRVNNFRAYVLSGIKYSLDLASRKKTNKGEASSNAKLHRNDISIEAGVGFEYYTNFFKFGTELKMGYGLQNLIIKEDNIYSGTIDQLRSKVFLLSFTFE